MKELVWFYVKKLKEDYKKFEKYVDILTDVVIDDIQSDYDLKQYFIFLLTINGYDGELVEDWLREYAAAGRLWITDEDNNILFSSEDEEECIDYILQQGKLN